MTIPLREYLAQRRADVQTSMKALRAELTEIDVAMAAIDFGEVKSRKERGTSGSGKKTLKEMALEVLRDHPEGLDAQAILAAIKDRFDLEIARESLSPQLSRLGQDNVLAREGFTWKLFLAPHQRAVVALNDETPGVSPPDVPDEEDEIEDLSDEIDDEIPF